MCGIGVVVTSATVSRDCKGVEAFPKKKQIISPESIVSVSCGSDLETCEKLIKCLSSVI